MTIPSAHRQAHEDTWARRHIRRQADEAERQESGDRPFHASRSSTGSDRDPIVARAVVEAKRGDQDAMRYLYTRYSHNVYGYALSMVRDPDEAEDVTQQVFCKLMANLHRYELRNVPFAAWIVRMTRNQAIDKLRERREIPCEEVFGPSVPAEDLDRVRARDLRDALVELPEDQRGVMIMRHILGLSPREISERLDKTEASVHGLHNRGRAALKRELIKLDAAPSLA